MTASGRKSCRTRHKDAMMLLSMRTGYRSAMLASEAAPQPGSQTAGSRLPTFKQRQDRGRTTKPRLIMAQQAEEESRVTAPPSHKSRGVLKARWMRRVDPWVPSTPD